MFEKKATPIINPSTENLTIKYDCTNGKHMVYVGLGGQVRRVMFPERETAVAFVRSIGDYGKLKVNM